MFGAVCWLFSKFVFFQNNLPGTLSECQTVLDPDQDRWFVGLDLDPNCLLFAMLPLARKEFNTHADVPIGK